MPFWSSDCLTNREINLIKLSKIFLIIGVLGWLINFILLIIFNSLFLIISFLIMGLIMLIGLIIYLKN